jgi:hypothetical protein
LPPLVLVEFTGFPIFPVPELDNVPTFIVPLVIYSFRITCNFVALIAGVDVGSVPVQMKPEF